MDRIIKVGETDPNLTKVYFDITLLGTNNPALGENGFQPQRSVNSNSFDSTGISVLTAIGFGKYSANLSHILNAGDIIETRYSRVGITNESRGDTFLVVNNDFTLANLNPLGYFEYYGTLNDAENFFSTRLNVPAWTEASTKDKINSLRMATQAIDNLNFSGCKNDVNQNLEFPRNGSLIIPDDIIKATYLCGYRYLDGWDLDLELENTRVTEHKFGPATTIYSPTAINDWILAGIPSGQAWQYLKQYLQDPLQIDLTRIS